MANLHCHCSTAHSLGAQPAPAPRLFPKDGVYIRIVDEKGRLWLWRVDHEALEAIQDHRAKRVG